LPDGNCHSLFPFLLIQTVVRLGHVASFIVNADHSVFGIAQSEIANNSNVSGSFEFHHRMNFPCSVALKVGDGVTRMTLFYARSQ
jgi:hypothetical protein